MLSSLPPELLHQIIESTVPHTFHTTTYRDRQRTLCSLSLVSKQFQAIAQPLLYEVVWIKTLETIQRFESADKGAGTDGRASPGSGRKSVKEVAIGDSTKDEDAFLDVDADESSDLAALLDPAFVPNLKNFALVTSDARAAEALKASRFGHLVPQLQTLSFEIQVWKRLDSKLRYSSKTRTLIDCHVGDLLDTLRDENEVVHTRMYSPAENEDIRNWGSRLKASLEEFAISLGQIPTLSLQSLYLDTSLRPSPSLSPELLDVITKVVKSTQERQIDLVFETVSNDYTVDPCISPEFRRKHRARVEKEN
ncbi:hypothetical protein JCM5350_003055 [Sporobolomyces pararoseus]